MSYLKRLFLMLLISICVSSFASDKVLICIHGFMRNKSNMSLFNTNFKKKGWTVYRWYYPSQMKTIQEHGADLISLLNYVSKKHPGSPHCFVTHSMGGLVLRSALNTEGCPEESKMGKAVLIAPPNQGSAYGRFLAQFKMVEKIAGPYAGRELITTQHGGFEYLGEFPGSVDVLVIAGTCGYNPVIKGRNDGKVGVVETRLNTPHSFETVFAGHSWICHTPRTVDIAAEFLER